jgi:hypothetical protein
MTDDRKTDDRKTDDRGRMTEDGRVVFGRPSSSVVRRPLSSICKPAANAIDFA